MELRDEDERPLEVGDRIVWLLTQYDPQIPVNKAMIAGRGRIHRLDSPFHGAAYFDVSIMAPYDSGGTSIRKTYARRDCFPP